ncbi:hypothetical protein K227x_29150 [Rubripirellula lacrimiformis]|uniref:TIGR03790 family protein n=1 Tax=Rubripirellula lacrimiformis TaxID=1930273 RepID=A0A517NBL7_9BACT|nr:hypothetical protein [Rubripirellula lacrimiformis]QDT04523.1 hypothetical protein K227x_29150 [Rubripirellula lacrimiformis]
MRPNRWIQFSVMMLVVWGGVLRTNHAIAGVGPENVVVVVNAGSKVSRTVANHYVRLRDIPPSNVVLLPDVPAGLQVSLADFKSKILLPLFAELESRKVAGHVRVIAYSADFPTAVSVGEHTDRMENLELKKYQRPVASINGLTSLYQFVLSDSPAYLDLGCNLYARGAFDRSFQNPFLDAERTAEFDAAAKLLADESFQEAGDAFGELFSATPSQAPLAIRAAEAYAGAGDTKAATEMIVRAIRSGWQSSAYLTRSESLGPLVADAKFAPIMANLSDAPLVAQQPIGFGSHLAWMRNGYPSAEPADGIRYMLSCVLGVVHQRGSTVDQAVAVLQRSATGDRTYPDANFWFTKTGDVRSKTRLPAVTDALLWLGHLGLPAGIVRSAMPSQPGKCAGLMLGTATMPLANKSFEFVPGAIADNLTSLSGAFNTASQTKITELLHAGAALTNGAVAEPFSLQPKFTTAMSFGYYASGMTAIESFYMTIASPYQLLIVGDPLAQAYARPPLDRVNASIVDRLTGSKVLKISGQPPAVVDPATATPLGLVELFVDGKLLRQLPPSPSIEMNLNNGPPGFVEVRVAMVGGNMMQPRISKSQWFRLDDGPEPPVAEYVPGQVSCTASAPQANSIDWILYGEVVGTTAGKNSSFTPDRNQLGDGPLSLQPVAVIGDARIPGRPIWFEDPVDSPTVSTNTKMPRADYPREAID